MTDLQRLELRGDPAAAKGKVGARQGRALTCVKHGTLRQWFDGGAARLIQIKAPGDRSTDDLSSTRGRCGVTHNESLYLAFVLITGAVFAATLAWTSWYCRKK
jgi:hypothetical protein